MLTARMRAQNDPHLSAAAEDRLADACPSNQSGAAGYLAERDSRSGVGRVVPPRPGAAAARGRPGKLPGVIRSHVVTGGGLGIGRAVADYA